LSIQPRIKKINDKLSISNIEYELLTYKFNFTFSCSSNNWTDTLNHDLFSDTLETYKRSLEYYSAVNKLHLNGLIGYDSVGNRLRSISGTSMVSNIELQLKKDLDSVSILRLINLKYYNYTNPLTDEKMECTPPEALFMHLYYLAIVKDNTAAAKLLLDKIDTYSKDNEQDEDFDSMSYEELVERQRQLNELRSIEDLKEEIIELQEIIEMKEGGELRKP
jgi:hypothetical protein